MVSMGERRMSVQQALARSRGKLAARVENESPTAREAGAMAWCFAPLAALLQKPSCQAGAIRQKECKAGESLSV